MGWVKVRRLLATCSVSPDSIWTPLFTFPRDELVWSANFEIIRIDNMLLTISRSKISVVMSIMIEPMMLEMLKIEKIVRKLCRDNRDIN